MYFSQAGIVGDDRTEFEVAEGRASGYHQGIHFLRAEVFQYLHMTTVFF
jgi:hypothetical protein